MALIEPPHLEGTRVKIPPAVVHTIEVKEKSHFYHSGDNGDLIYSLAFIKSLGGGTLFLGHDSKWSLRAAFTAERVAWLEPLLKCQPYLQSVQYVDKVPRSVAYNLDDFRDYWFDQGKRSKIKVQTLHNAYAAHFNKPLVPEDKAWLTVPPSKGHGYPVVIHRSSRYRNDSFPWNDVVEVYQGKMLFVGLREEYDEWTRAYGNHAEFYQVKDALDMAQVIQNARVFIGNQSLPMALALGMGQNVIQEVCDGTPDCVLQRDNAQYWRKPWQQLRLTRFASKERKYVLPIPDENGIYQLGPCADAYGLGDFLTITPLAKHFGRKCCLNLPLSMARYGVLFANLCPVYITEDFPVFKHLGGPHMAIQKMGLFGLKLDPLPTVVLTEAEKVWARAMLSHYHRPIAFAPTCAKEWAHIRERPSEYWEPIVERLNDRDVLQFGRAEYPTVKGCARIPFLKLRQLAAMYSVIGEYLGADTGDLHLMLAVGGKATCVVPDAERKYVTQEWHYNSPRVSYINYNHPEQINLS